MIPALRTLLAGAIDYAGLFPPAGLGMADAARHYAEYRAGPDVWALGRFVIPAARLAELERDAGTLLTAGEPGPWRISALLGADVPDDLARVDAFNDRRRGAAAVDSVELKAATAEDIRPAREALARGLETFVELPLGAEPQRLLRMVADEGAMAKVRTGGVTADAFPAARPLARFLRACADLPVAFKATAGLHHPLRAEHRLTYEIGSGRAAMYGYLNVMLAAALALAGAGEDEIAEALEERSAAALRASGDGIEWRGWRLDGDALAAARRQAMRSFGSCSFHEPLDDLVALGYG